MSVTVRPAPAEAEAPPRRRWCRGTRIAVAATALWSTFLLAHLILSGRVWWWSLMEMVPPLAMAVPPLAIAIAAAWAARGVRWRLWLVAGATAAIVAPMTGVNPGALRGPSDADADLTLFVWNTDYWHNWGSDPDEFYDYLLAQDADVYLLQEYLNRTDRVVEIDDEAALREHFPGYHIAIASEMVTLSRFPIVAASSLDTAALIGPDDPGAPPEDDPWTEYWTTKILRTDIDYAGQVLSLYNLHLSVPVPTSDASPLSADFYAYVRAQYERRSSQFQVLNEDLDANPHPVVVAGDFNSTSISAGVGALRDRLECPDPDTGLYPTSWPTRRFEFPKLWRLDWACTGGGPEIAEYRFVSSEGMSDHDAQFLALIVDGE